MTREEHMAEYAAKFSDTELSMEFCGALEPALNDADVLRWLAALCIERIKRIKRMEAKS